MKRRYLFLLLITGLVPLALEARLPKSSEVESAYRRGLAYVAGAQDPKSVYADRYLAYVYPKEDVPGPAKHHYPVTYRVIDGLTATTYLADLRPDLGPLNEVLEKARHDLQALPPSGARWKFPTLNP